MSHIARELPFETSFKILDVKEFLADGYKVLIDLFGSYDRSPSIDEKQKIVADIFRILIASMKIEESFLYPAIKKLLKEKAAISGAIMNHTSLKYLMVEIDGIDADSEIYDIKIRVLGEHALSHFKETQIKILSQVTECETIDLWALGSKSKVGIEALA